MRNVLLVVVICVCGRAGIAQELNIGLHLNPAFSTPFVNEKSVRDEDLKVGVFRLGYNIGTNVNVKFKSMSVEVAANVVRKSVSIYHREQHAGGGSSYYRVNMPGVSLEFPLLINLLLDRHNKNTIYDLYFVAGAAYDVFRQDSFGSRSSAGAGASALSVTGSYKGPLSQQAIAPIVGFKINAVVRRLGLIDYGLTFHIPLLVSGPYEADAKYSVGSASTIYASSIYARPAYLDVKLCYYLLNFGERFRRVRYRGG